MIHGKRTILWATVLATALTVASCAGLDLSGNLEGTSSVDTQKNRSTKKPISDLPVNQVSGAVDSANGNLGSKPSNDLTNNQSNNGINNAGGNQLGETALVVSTEEQVGDLNAIADDVETLEQSLDTSVALDQFEALDQDGSGGFSVLAVNKSATTSILPQPKREAIKCRAVAEVKYNGPKGGHISASQSCKGDNVERHVLIKNDKGVTLFDATQSVTTVLDPEPTATTSNATGTVTVTQTVVRGKAGHFLGGSTTIVRVGNYTLNKSAKIPFKVEPVSEEANSAEQALWKEGIATIKRSHQARDFRPVRAANANAGKNPALAPNYVKREESTAIGGKSASASYEIVGNPHEGMTISGSRELLNGKITSFTMQRNADGSGSQTRNLLNGHTVTVSFGTDGSKSLNLKNKEGKDVASMTISPEGQRKIKRVKASGKPATEEVIEGNIAPTTEASS
ncbi:MAG: hypothetical protein HY692_05840 [Cyanobacteria bacterium NC_groundwater_1444_Ag_S-0.65um_54_12]|nr:hypothetical protein [Cyanobacteria bacterium NC_groundwater_1444_Ag_S-0.65um_54_12]